MFSRANKYYYCAKLFLYLMTNCLAVSNTACITVVVKTQMFKTKTKTKTQIFKTKAKTKTLSYSDVQT